MKESTKLFVSFLIAIATIGLIVLCFYYPIILDIIGITMAVLLAILFATVIVYLVLFGGHL